MVIGRGVRSQDFANSLIPLSMLLCFASSARLTEVLCSTAGPKADCGKLNGLRIGHIPVADLVLL